MGVLACWQLFQFNNFSRNGKIVKVLLIVIGSGKDRPRNTPGRLEYSEGGPCYNFSNFVKSFKYGDRSSVVERLPVEQEVGGSNPLDHPKCL